MKKQRPHKRAGYWYLIRQVPAAFSDLDRRVLVRTSTKIAIADDPRGIAAQRAVDKLNADLEEYWRGLYGGGGAETRTRYNETRRRARALGFDYQPASDLQSATIEDLLKRIESLTKRGTVEDEKVVSAVLGGEERPPVMISSLIEEYEAHARASLGDLSPDQLRKWKNPKRRAVANFLEVVNDKAITEITRNDALDFREWWQERIVNEGLNIGTANKDIGHLNKMMRTLNDAFRLGIQSPFSSLRIEGETDGQRTAYDPAYVQANFMKDGMFDDLNEDARRLIFLLADTGLRLSEATNLTRETIRLDCEVPHVKVMPVGRRMKTEQSERDIPLVGAALAAMRLHPDGFPRYRDKPSGLSALVNKALTARKLRPIEGQSLYSLRHTFEDQLTAVEAPEKLIANLMGHKYSRPKYGSGPSLAQKRDWLLKIAFRPPSIV